MRQVTAAGGEFGQIIVCSELVVPLSSRAVALSVTCDYYYGGVVCQRCDRVGHLCQVTTGLDPMLVYVRSDTVMFLAARAVYFVNACHDACDVIVQFIGHGGRDCG